MNRLLSNSTATAIPEALPLSDSFKAGRRLDSFGTPMSSCAISSGIEACARETQNTKMTASLRFRGALKSTAQ